MAPMTLSDATSTVTDPPDSTVRRMALTCIFGFVVETTSTGTDAWTGPEPSSTLTTIEPAAPVAVPAGADTVSAVPETEAETLSGLDTSAYAKSRGLAPSGSVTASARFCVTGSSPAPTRTGVGVSVGGWFDAGRTMKVRDSLALSAPESLEDPSETSRETVALPEKPSRAWTSTEPSPLAAAWSMPLEETMDPPSDRRAERPGRTVV